MQIGADKSRSDSKIQPDLMPLRKDLGSLFQSQLAARGSDIFNNPGGISGSIFQNLYGADPSGDFLGARNTLQNLMSGQGLQQYLGTANQQLMPTALANILAGGNALRNAAGPAGLRYSTDLINAQRGMAGDILAKTQAQALQAALGMSQQAGDAAQNIYGLSSQMRESDLARLLPTMVAYATGFAPVGTNSWGFNAGVG
jgi:hypothetical protein